MTTTLLIIVACSLLSGTLGFIIAAILASNK